MKLFWSTVVLATCLLSNVGPSAAASFDHAIWDRLTREYVDSEGRVAYRDLFAHDQAALAEYAKQLAAAEPATWPQEEQLAFWINAYNAATVIAISQGRSAESFLGRGKLFKFWKIEVAGGKRSLGDIEHKILRKQFSEPRIHFAIVCASTSCPPLRAEAYRADQIEAQLQQQAQLFINDSSRNEFDLTASRVRLSKIFDWFSEDFEHQGSLLEFVARYVEDPDVRSWLQSGAPDAKRDHLPYDWTLNAQAGQRPR